MVLSLFLNLYGHRYQPAFALIFLMIVLIFGCGFESIVNADNNESAVESDVCDDYQVTGFNKLNLEDFFTYNLLNASDETTLQIIDNASQQLSNSPYFLIKNFLSEYGHNLLTNILKNNTIYSKLHHHSYYKTIFSEKTDYIKFPNNSITNEVHARNRLNKLELYSLTMNKLIDTMFVSMYNYDGILNLVKRIVIKSGLFNNLYRSSDEDAGTYLFFYKSGDRQPWHFDEHPFTCILLLKKPEVGGRYRFIRNSYNIDHGGYNWQLIDHAIDNYNDYVDNINGTDNENDFKIEEIIANERDLYCHNGNVTLHSSSVSYGQFDVDNQSLTFDDFVRTIQVLSFADYPGFEHKQCKVYNKLCKYKNTK